MAPVNYKVHFLQVNQEELFDILLLPAMQFLTPISGFLHFNDNTTSLYFLKSAFLYA